MKGGCSVSETGPSSLFPEPWRGKQEFEGPGERYYSFEAGGMIASNELKAEEGQETEEATSGTMFD